MDMLELERTVNPEWWIRKLSDCDWTGGQYLYSLLKEKRFHERCGEKAGVWLLADGSRLVSFCTYAEKDDIPDTELKPWMGFVYTDPDYRGRRLMGKLISKVKELAREDGYDTVYLSTEEKGLYEKYGAVFRTVMKNGRGEDCRVYGLDTYGFYGWENAVIPAGGAEYPGIRTPRDLYNVLWHVWSRETCAPRMRQDWSEDNRTLGQCSVTAFLAQDLFGGKVRGIPLPEGGFHCFNVVGDCVFDLTSEQFGAEKLDYARSVEQLRHDHFLKTEKRERYESLKAALKEETARRSRQTAEGAGGRKK